MSRCTVHEQRDSGSSSSRPMGRRSRWPSASEATSRSWPTTTEMGRRTSRCSDRPRGSGSCSARRPGSGGRWPSACRGWATGRFPRTTTATGRRTWRSIGRRPGSGSSSARRRGSPGAVRLGSPAHGDTPVPADYDGESGPGRLPADDGGVVHLRLGGRARRRRRSAPPPGRHADPASGRHALSVFSALLTRRLRHAGSKCFLVSALHRRGTGPCSDRSDVPRPGAPSCWPPWPRSRRGPPRPGGGRPGHPRVFRQALEQRLQARLTVPVKIERVHLNLFTARGRIANVQIDGLGGGPPDRRPRRARLPALVSGASGGPVRAPLPHLRSPRVFVERTGPDSVNILQALRPAEGGRRRPG